MKPSPPISSQNMNTPTPHVLIFPYPVQGHVNSMLKLAQLLCLAGLKVTFLNSAHNHRLLLRHSDAARRPGLCFEAVPDGLPEDHPRSGKRVSDLHGSLQLTAKPVLKEILIRMKDDAIAPLTCLIADGIMGFPSDVAEEVGVPLIAFRTSSASYFWSCFCIPKLLEAGDIPFRDDNMDEPVKSIPGLDTLLRRRDLPSFFQVSDLSHPPFQAAMVQTQRTRRANSLILNTFEDLEGPMLSFIRAHCNPRVYSIGPLSLQLRHKLQTSTLSDEIWLNNLWQVDRTCMAWLDGRPDKSVIYVSFGSLTILTEEHLTEFWTGLVRTKRPFLWVMRPDLIDAKDLTSAGVGPEIVEGTRERGCVVSWAPQEEVLAHPAVGGFLTHSGWNSTMESVVAGVPMLCWPYFADQQLNSRRVEKWGIGVDMKDRCDRETVEKMVNDLMEGKRAELDRSMDVVSGLAKRSMDDGGTSCCNLDRLIEDIREMAMRA